jgi:type IV pilus assembly protein PilM
MTSFTRRSLRRDEIVAIDLGTRVLKAVHLRRRGSEVILLDYALVEVVPGEHAVPREQLTELLRKALKALSAPTRRAVLVLGSAKSILAHLNLPAVAPSDLRRMIKLSPKNYLQRDLPDHVFDCYVSSAARTTGANPAPRDKLKSKVLVGGARQADLDEVTLAAREAGWVVEDIALGPVGIANAFRVRPDEVSDEVVALLEIGFSSSTINIMQGGQLLLTRTINFGAEKIADVLEKASRSRELPANDEDTSFSEEVEVQSRLQRAILLLSREVDASIGFFVSQQEATVSRVLVSGGSARSQFILQTLEAELAVPCESWDPSAGLRLELPEARRQEIEYEAPQFTVAVGAGLGVLREDLIQLNLLAEEREAAEWRRQDPVRYYTWGAVALVAAMLGWAAMLGGQLWKARRQLRSLESELQAHRSGLGESISNAQRARDLETTLAALDKQAQNRSLWAPALNALQFATLPEIQVYRVKLEQAIVKPPPPPPPKPVPKTSAPKPPTPKSPPVIERLTLIIQGKNYGETRHIDQFIERIQQQAFFLERLRTNQPVLLTDLQARQVDPAQPNRTCALFTVTCHFAERPMNE